MLAQGEQEQGIHGQQEKENGGGGQMDGVGERGRHAEQADMGRRTGRSLSREQGHGDAGQADRPGDDVVDRQVALVGDQKKGNDEQDAAEEIAHVGMVVEADRALAGQARENAPAQDANRRQQDAQPADELAQSQVGDDETPVPAAQQAGVLRPHSEKIELGRCTLIFHGFHGRSPLIKRMRRTMPHPDLCQP